MLSKLYLARRPVAQAHIYVLAATLTVACGSDDPDQADLGLNPGGTGGASGSPGTTPVASGGSGPVAPSSGGSVALPGNTGGSGGAVSAAGAAGEPGSAGAVGIPSGGGAGGNAQAAGGNGGVDAVGGAGGGANVACPGLALSFTSNLPINGDPAMSRVIVDFATSPDLPLGNSPRTIEFWAFVPSNAWAGDANTLFEYGDQSLPNAGFGLDFGGVAGTIDPYTNGSFDNDNQPTTLDPAVDQWIHFAMTTDGTTVVSLYVNGELRSTRTSPGNMLMTALTPLTIGGNPRGAYFNGMIDEFRVWNVERTQTEVMSTMASTLVGDEAGLVAYFKFDEPDGTTALDATTTAGHVAHDGTLMAASPAQLPERVASTAPITTCQ